MYPHYVYSKGPLGCTKKGHNLSPVAFGYLKKAFKHVSRKQLPCIHKNNNFPEIPAVLSIIYIDWVMSVQILKYTTNVMVLHFIFTSHFSSTKEEVTILYFFMWNLLYSFKNLWCSLYTVQITIFLGLKTNLALICIFINDLNDQALHFLA